MSEDQSVSVRTRVVLAEVVAALERLSATGEEWTIFINKMALTQTERQAIRDCLGQGAISIKMENTDEPAEWLESGISGVWYGVFYDQSHSPILETIEVALFPRVAAAQPEDLKQGLAGLTRCLTDLEQGGI